jgi:hypothetical protein
MTPEFGALVKAVNGDGSVVYGLIYNETVEDDALVRQLVAAGIDEEVINQDQRQNRQVPIVVDVLTVGSGQGLNILHRLPPRPPGALDRIYACNNAEVARFSTRHDWLRTVLAAADVPTEQLVAAALRKAAAARPPDQREVYLVGAGRELARWLPADLTRLDGILQQLREEV